MGPHVGIKDKEEGSKKGGGVRKKGERLDEKRDEYVNMFTSNVEHKTVLSLCYGLGVPTQEKTPPCIDLHVVDGSKCYANQ